MNFGMRKRGWSGRVVLRYSLFQLPALGLVALVLIVLWSLAIVPLWLALIALSLWVAKDVVMFPFVWRAYSGGVEASAHLIGVRAIAKDRLSPSGYVRIGDELWRAEVMEDSPEVGKGACVEVKGIRGLTLLVSPVGKGDR